MTHIGPPHLAALPGGEAPAGLMPLFLKRSRIHTLPPADGHGDDHHGKDQDGPENDKEDSEVRV
jgi:hypothetical protein